ELAARAEGGDGGRVAEKQVARQVLTRVLGDGVTGARTPRRPVHLVEEGALEEGDGGGVAAGAGAGQRQLDGALAERPVEPLGSEAPHHEIRQLSLGERDARPGGSGRGKEIGGMGTRHAGSITSPDRRLSTVDLASFARR